MFIYLVMHCLFITPTITATENVETLVGWIFAHGFFVYQAVIETGILYPQPPVFYIKSIGSTEFMSRRQILVAADNQIRTAILEYRQEQEWQEFLKFVGVVEIADFTASFLLVCIEVAKYYR